MTDIDSNFVFQSSIVGHIESKTRVLPLNSHRTGEMSTMATDEIIQTNFNKYKHEPNRNQQQQQTNDFTGVVPAPNTKIDTNDVTEYQIVATTTHANHDNNSNVSRESHKNVSPPSQVYHSDNKDGNTETDHKNLEQTLNASNEVRDENGDTNKLKLKKNGMESSSELMTIENTRNENGNRTGGIDIIPVQINQEDLMAKEDSLRAQISDGLVFGRLQCENQVLNITESVVKIGRNSKASKVNFHVSDNTYISRKHIQIIYDRSNQDFFMLCLSKNGIFVDDEFQNKRTVPLKLPQRCTFRFPSTKILVNFESYIEKKENNFAENALIPMEHAKSKQQMHSNDLHTQQNPAASNQSQTIIDNNTNKQTNARTPLKINIPQHDTGKCNTDDFDFC